jgi:hypothetical protein
MDSIETNAKRRKIGNHAAIYNNQSGDWVSNSVVSKAVEEYVSYIRNLPARKTHTEGNWCLDQHGNQLQGCSCVFVLYNKKQSADEVEKFEYEIICCEMASWFSAAKESENLRAMSGTPLSEQHFHKLFHQTMVLKGHPKTGRMTKMVDMSIMPAYDSYKTNDDERLHVPENRILTVSTFCLNTVMGIWRELVKQMDEDMEEWKTINYQAILYQGARNQMDSCTQLKRQKLFYSRLGDFINAEPNKKRINFKWAAQQYQERNELGRDKQSVSDWKSVNFYNWRNWNFQSIHIIRSHSFFKYNTATRDLVKRHRMGITTVSGDSVKTLLSLMEELWKHRNTRKWSKVSQDKDLWFLPFPPSHSFLTAVDVMFRGELGGYRATGQLANLIGNEEQRKKINTADTELKNAILEQLNSIREEEKPSTKVAYQPSFVASEVHNTQAAHFDYKNEKGRNGETKDYQK